MYRSALCRLFFLLDLSVITCYPIEALGTHSVPRRALLRSIGSRQRGRQNRRNALWVPARRYPNGQKSLQEDSHKRSGYLDTEPGLILVTYGNGEKWAHAADELAGQARALGMFSDAKVFTQVPAEILQTGRWDGHLKDSPQGWWFWKPIIIAEQFKSTADGDVLIYLDAGGEVHKGSSWNTVRTMFRGSSWDKVRALLREQTLDVLAFQMPWNLEAVWTKADIFKRFHTSASSSYGQSPQIAATFFAVRKSAAAANFITKWIDLAADLQLISDWQSCLPEAAEFKENRNDQSLFSMLLKANNGFASGEGREDFLVDDLHLKILDYSFLNYSDYGEKYEKYHGGHATANREPKPRPSWAQPCPSI